MRYLALLPAFTLSILANTELALAQRQDPFRGEGRYPNFRNVSGLPGGGFGVQPDGNLGIDGAWVLSTPIAYSLGPRRIALVAGAMSYDNRLAFPRPDGRRRDADTNANGTAAGMFGQAYRGWRVTVSGKLLSGALDNVLDLLVTPPQRWESVRVSAGVQDAFSTGGTKGEDLDLPLGGGTSRSLFVVATWEPMAKVYLSAGIGENRFHQGFGSISAGFLKYTRVFAEYEGWHWNAGIAGQYREFGLTIGTVAGRYPFWTLSLSF